MQFLNVGQSSKKLKKVLLVFSSLVFTMSSSFNLDAFSKALSTEETDVIIVGAGLSGLSTAYNLKKAGLSYKILELTPRVGGRARTAKYGDVKVEAGLAEFWESNPAHKMIKELNVPYEEGDDLSYSSMIIDKKLYPFTQNSNDEFLRFLFNKKEYEAFQKWNKETVAKYEKIKKKPIDKKLMELKDISLEDWMNKSGLPRKVKEFVRLSIEPEIGTSWSYISALDGIAELHIFLGKGETPYSLKEGNESLIEALADYTGRENIGLEMQVTRFKNLKDGVEVDAMDTTNFKHHTYKAKYAVSTIPLFRLSELQFSPELPKLKQQAITTQSWGSYFTAHVLVSKEAQKYWTNKQGETLLPILSDSPLGVIYFAKPTPEGDFIINLLITGEHAEKFNHRAILFEDVRRDLNEAFENLWKGSTKYIKKYDLYRYHPRAIGAWPVGRSRFDELSEDIRKPFGNIYFAGDFTENSHSDGAVISANRVSNQIIAKEKAKKK